MKTKTILLLLNILAWILFVALCVQAGAIIVSSIVWLVMPESVDRLYKWNDLTVLFNYDHGHFTALVAIISIVTVLKACLFYLIIRLISDKQLSLSRPFSKQVQRFTLLGAVLALLIGLFSKYGVDYARWLTDKKIPIPDPAALELDGAHVWIFMAVILFVIAQVFKRGMELQAESELTV
ncbi:hypothetical protein GCM10027051_02230 [Niabella terrae]